MPSENYPNGCTSSCRHAQWLLRQCCLNTKTSWWYRACPLRHQFSPPRARRLLGGKRMKRRLIGVTAAVLGTVLLSGVGLEKVAAADPVPTTVMLPLFGAPLTFTITSGPGGALADVSVDPAA